MTDKLRNYIEQMIEGIKVTKDKTQYKSVLHDLDDLLNAVDQQHQELREKIKKLDPSMHYSEWGDDYSNGFDDAITDVLKLLT